ncbi:DUF6668 family protein [Nocardioides lijunqiniae]|uniref:DUF6668 family protein n=1 Tax=Nocardioides lijunqiniae TaxID=2760832 RepID=UPI001877B45C|nr:DUF6668 family protein [Nocardioides lijunqiniae]
MPSIAEYEAATGTEAVLGLDVPNQSTTGTGGESAGVDPASASVVWIGAHGGAGARSLAAATGVGVVGGEHEVTTETQDGPPQVLVVARSDARGLDAAAETVRTVPGGVQLIGLVISADAPGRPPRAIRTRIHELSGTVPHLVTIPWISQWRLTPGSPHPAVTKALAPLSITTPHQKEQKL